MSRRPAVDEKLNTVDRRDFLRHSAGTLAATGALWATSQQLVRAEETAGYSLPALDYPYDALEPVIDATTMTIHHTKHHQGYVSKVNAALEGHPEWLSKPIDEVLRGLDQLPESIQTAVRNNGGGHANHTLFWKVMKPGGGGEPSGALAEAIASRFQSFDNFKEVFGKAAAGQFGSGWAWLAVGPQGLEVIGLPNQDSPWLKGMKPILGLDVWEHAYYLKYQNRRTDYIAAWWNVVNWQQVAKNFQA